MLARGMGRSPSHFVLVPSKDLGTTVATLPGNSTRWLL